MARSKARIKISGVVSHFFAADFLQPLYENMGKQPRRMEYHDLCKIANAKMPGKIRGEWYELDIQFWPERKYHVGAYMECECPFEITFKTTCRNMHRAEEVLRHIPSPVMFGGYSIGEETEIRSF